MGNHFDWDDVPRCTECQGRPCVCKSIAVVPLGKPTFSQLCEDLLKLQAELTTSREEGYRQGMERACEILASHAELPNHDTEADERNAARVAAICDIRAESATTSPSKGVR